MYWCISGNHHQIYNGFKHNSFGWWGNASNEIISSFTNYDFKKKMKSTDCSWSLFSSSASDSCIEPDAGMNDASLLKKVRQNPNQCHTSIRYFKKDQSQDSLVGITMVIPEKLYTDISKLFEIILLSQNELRYHISLYCELTDSTLPSFLDGLPHLGTEMDVSIQPPLKLAA